MFNLWDLPINYFYNKVNLPLSNTNNRHEKLKRKLKIESPVFFGGGVGGDLGKYTKTKVKLPVKENVMPVFKQKRTVLYAAIRI